MTQAAPKSAADGGPEEAEDQGCEHRYGGWHSHDSDGDGEDEADHPEYELLATGGVGAHSLRLALGGAIAA